MVLAQIRRADTRGEHQAKAANFLRGCLSEEFPRKMLPLKNFPKRIDQSPGNYVPWRNQVLFQVEIDYIEREGLNEGFSSA